MTMTMTMTMLRANRIDCVLFSFHREAGHLVARRHKTRLLRQLLREHVKVGNGRCRFASDMVEKRENYLRSSTSNGIIIIIIIIIISLTNLKAAT